MPEGQLRTRGRCGRKRRPRLLIRVKDMAQATQHLLVVKSSEGTGGVRRECPESILGPRARTKKEEQPGHLCVTKHSQPPKQV